MTAVIGSSIVAANPPTEYGVTLRRRRRATSTAWSSKEARDYAALFVVGRPHRALLLLFAHRPLADNIRCRPSTGTSPDPSGPICVIQPHRVVHLVDTRQNRVHRRRIGAAVVGSMVSWRWRCRLDPTVAWTKPGALHCFAPFVTPVPPSARRPVRRPAFRSDSRPVAPDQSKRLY